MHPIIRDQLTTLHRICIAEDVEETQDTGVEETEFNRVFTGKTRGNVTSIERITNQTWKIFVPFGKYQGW